MDYLFNNLYYNIPIPEKTKRNIILERKICLKICYKTSIFIFYYTTYKNNLNYSKLIIIQNMFITKLYNRFLYSDIFKENLIFFIKNYAGVAFIDYMNKQFHINPVKLTNDELNIINNISN